jgi:hypothetical protein
VRDDRRARTSHVLVRIGRAQCRRFVDREPLRDVPGQRIVRGGLVGDEIEVLAARRELRNEVRRVAEQPDRQRAAVACRAPDARQRVVERIGGLVEIPRLQTALDPLRVDLDAEDRRAGHRPRERLRAAHAAEAGGKDRPAAQVRRVEVLLAGGGERLVRALQDPLAADVDPGAGGHLAVHRQALGLEPPELVPGRPLRHEQRVRDQHARCALVRREDADGLAALDEQGLVGAELEQRRDDRPQRPGAPRGLAGSAVDDEVLGTLGHLGVEVVEQHSQRRLRRPLARVQLGPARRADGREIATERFHALRQARGRAHSSSPASASTAATKEPSRIAAATASMSPASGRSSRSRGDRSRTAARAARPPTPGSSGA